MNLGFESDDYFCDSDCSKCASNRDDQSDSKSSILNSNSSALKNGNDDNA